jgi:hypothetical protein
VPLTALLLHGLPAERQPKALELANLLRIAAGAIGIALQGIVLYRRTPLHMTRLAEYFIPGEAVFDQALQTLMEQGLNDMQALATFAKLAARAEAIRGINDAFWIAGCVFLCLAGLVWCAHPTLTPVKQTAKRFSHAEANGPFNDHLQRKRSEHHPTPLLAQRQCRQLISLEAEQAKAAVALNKASGYQNATSQQSNP